MRPSLMTRWIVAALLTVSVPLCCCQGQQILSLLWGESVTHAPAQGEEGHSADSIGHASHDGQIASGALAQLCQDGSCQDGSCDDGPCNDNGDCNCGNTNLLAGSPTGLSTSTILASSPLLCGSTKIAFQNLTQQSVRLGAVELAPTPRPPTSLLRLHCALLV